MVFLKFPYEILPEFRQNIATNPNTGQKSVPQIFLILRDTPCLHNLLSKYLIPIQHRFQMLNRNLSFGDEPHERTVVLFFRAV